MFLSGASQAEATGAKMKAGPNLTVLVPSTLEQNNSESGGFY